MLVRDAMHACTVTISGHHSLPDAVLTMENLKVKRLPVLMGDRLVGLITDGDILRHLPALHEGLTPWAFTYRAAKVRVSEAMCPTVLTTTPETTLDTAIQMLLSRRVGGLPVLDDEEQLVGMLTLTDVLRAAVHAPRDTWGTVREHMTDQVVGVDAGAPASDAAARLKVSRLRVLPVTHEGVLVGVIHQTDIGAAVERGAAVHGDTVLGDQFFLKGTAARDLMRPPTDQVLASVPMRDAVAKMLNADVHGLPVVSDSGSGSGGSGRLLGVLTVSDVLKALVGAPEGHHV
jgi:CBS domain-containing protein